MTRGAGKSEECLYCLRKALVKDPQDIMALWEISAQYKVIGKMSLVSRSHITKRDGTDGLGSGRVQEDPAI